MISNYRPVTFGAKMYHEISGIEYDFQGGCDELLKFVLQNISVEELIRGTSLCDEVTYLDDDGYIYQSALELMETSELIDWRNWEPGTAFMDELSVLRIDEQKLKKVRQGAAAKDVLTDDEIREITDLVAEHVVLSLYYADKQILFDPNDAVELDDSSEEKTSQIGKPCYEIESSEDSEPIQSVQEILNSGSPIFGSYTRGMFSIKRLKDYREHFNHEPPVWLTCIAANLITTIVDLSIKKNQPLPDIVSIPIQSIEPYSRKREMLFSLGKIVGDHLVLGDYDE